MDHKKYRIAVVGTGGRSQGFVKQLYAGTRSAELFGLCDIDGQWLDFYCQKHGFDKARRFTDLGTLLAEPGLDAIVACVPEFAHADVAIAALKAGKPVYLEKPVAQSLAECRRVAQAQRQTGTLLYVGFNLRALAVYEKLKEIVASGVLGQIMHVSGAEQLHAYHTARFQRRFHRWSKNSGGMLNTKCCHDLDMILWLVGHEHRVTRVSSFGGCNFLTKEKQPAKYCSQCPDSIHDRCPYAALADFQQGRTRQDNYPGDLCVFHDDKDLVDNQSVMLEFEHGVRADFQLQMFQAVGRRRSIVWGEKGKAELNVGDDGVANIRVDLQSGEVIQHRFTQKAGGHGGCDPLMIPRFVEAMRCGSANGSGVREGLAASLMAFKADESRLSGQTVTIAPQEWNI